MLIALLLSVVLVAGLPQEKERGSDERPKKGDTVVTRGCVDGGAVDTLEVATEDGKKTVAAALTFRLTGDKKLLKTIKNEHSGHSDRLTGVLKTDLPDERRGVGTRIGNTSIGIGIVDPRGSTQRALPVLEVTSFEHTDMRCR